MIITRPRGQRPYILEAERELEPEDQTVFLLTDLTERDRVGIMDQLRVSAASEGGTASITGSGTRTYMAVRAGLVGWQNLKDETGADVPFETVAGNSRKPKDETLALLDWETKVELQGAIMDAAFPDDEDKEK